MRGAEGPAEESVRALGAALLASDELAVLVLDERSRVLEANPAARRVLDLPDDVHGVPLSTMADEDDARLLAEAFEAAEPGPHLLRSARGRGRPDRALIVSRVTSPGTGGRAVRVLVGRPAEDELLREARLLEGGRHQIAGLFASGIAHELNNRLSTVTTFADLLLADADPGSRDVEDLSDIKQAGLDAAEIIRRLDLFAGGHPGGPAGACPDEVVRGLEKLLRRFLGAELALSLELDAEGAEVEVPSVRLEEILVTLVADARSGAARGGPATVTVRTRTAAVQPSGRIMIVLEVRGPAGPGPSGVERAAARFFGSPDARRGAGPSLPALDEIVRALGGALDVLPGPDGTTIRRVALPAAVRAVDDAGAGPARRGVDGPCGDPGAEAGPNPPRSG